MNTTIENIIRDKIKEGLSQLPESWGNMFKRMYNKGNLETSINEVIDNMPTKKLDWALTQVENSIKKLNKKNEQV